MIGLFTILQSFLENLPLVRTIEELEKQLEPVFNHYEIEHFLCTNMYGLPFLADRKPMFGNWETEWVNHYVNNSYFVEDAVPLYAHGINGDYRPYYWSDLIAVRDLSKQQFRIFYEADDAELREGLVVPIPVSRTELAMVSLAGRRFKKDDVVKGILWTICMQSHRQARDILQSLFEGQLLPNRMAQAATPDILDLSPTETTNIKLLAADNDAEAIAVIRGVSAHTVRKQLRSAMKKLKVDTLPGLVGIAKDHKLP
jgi:DNA-binding CsgD family transcriptional regulator